ncbi:flagellar biosynthetic protein FliR [Paenibacillus sp. J31TS4]|uniref:flagellar biosynthetic protein FliR n=1 Tax=Paenibacillus sp. J31TS4 TaxID=2807195 RepID=UPI001BCADD2B|nr:flagellar biosynthetic protein FliR [Paenibacillus sp. J31TS4]
MNLLLAWLPGGLLVFCRITSFFVVTPVFSARNVPASFKIGLSFFLTLITVTSIGQLPALSDGAYLLSIIREIMIGLLMGFVAYLFFAVVQAAGTFIDMQMGFAMANVIDPLTGTQSPLIGNLKYMLATLLFLAFNGHHYLIQAIIESYRWVPLSSDAFARVAGGQVTEYLVRSMATAFELAFQMAAPLVAALFLVDVGLGILSRAAPQFNVFVLGLPLKILVGLLLLIVVMTGMASLFGELFTKLIYSVRQLLDLLGPGTGGPS